MTRKQLSLIFLFAAAVAGLVPAAETATANPCDPCGYRPVCTTVYQMQPCKQYCVQYKTVYQQQKITRCRPVWETKVEQRRCYVMRPVTQTVEQEQRFVVTRPVWETQMRDASYNQVRNVVETHQREEQFNVTRPVWETQMQPRSYQVRQYVTQTVQRQVPQVSYQPVTTYDSKVVDQGKYVVQQYNVQGPRGQLTPDPLRNIGRSSGRRYNHRNHPSRP